MEIKHIFLTVKCLLIAPNPESALNEEAGRLLLEDYDAYFKHAKLITSIHASHQSFEKMNADSLEANSDSSGGGDSSRTIVADDTNTLSSSPKKRVLSEKLNKKRTLRRL